MMFMTDSERAGEIAALNGRSIGLHLNLTHPYDAAPGPVRERQLRAIPHFRHMRRRRWVADPRPSIRGLLRDCVRDQLEEFRRIYGHDPTHIDGHHHVHVTADVLMVLPRDIPIRQTLSAPPGRRSLPRWVKQRWIARRFRSTESFWAFYQLHPALWGDGFGAAIDRSRTESVEIMCHPSDPAELKLLLADDWRGALSHARLGGYEELRDD
jgi:predicted glycoside hydrolase/deacetylase ChbG (UPF0249 family)